MVLGGKDHSQGDSVKPRKKRVKSRPVKSLERAVRALTTAQRAMQVPYQSISG